MGMFLQSMEGKRRHRIDEQGRTCLSTSYNLVEKPWWRALGEVKGGEGKAHWFDCCRNLLLSRQMETKADGILLTHAA